MTEEAAARIEAALVEASRATGVSLKDLNTSTVNCQLEVAKLTALLPAVVADVLALKTAVKETDEKVRALNGVVGNAEKLETKVIGIEKEVVAINKDRWKVRGFIIAVTLFATLGVVLNIWVLIKQALVP